VGDFVPQSKNFPQKEKKKIFFLKIKIKIGGDSDLRA